ncbi:MAG: hypothetical protein Q8L07_15000 [Sediminibacterium sp.]|nr:hypothetical protein [Sediminibacterium sp.]
MSSSNIPEEREKRLREWERWLELFKQSEELTFNYIDNAPYLLNNLYWDLVDRYLKQVLVQKKDKAKGLIHPYKIIATSEISVMMTEPIVYESDKKEERLLCAKLAYFISTQILEGWKVEGVTTNISPEQIEKVALFQEPISATDSYPKSFAIEHIEWLYHLNVTVEKPLLINAQCWRMFYITCLAVAQQGELTNKT